MDGFLKWFFVFISEILKGFRFIFDGLWSGLKHIFNIKNYITIFKEHSPGFKTVEWILAILSIVIVIAVFVIIAMIIILALRKYIRFRHSIVSNEDIIEELGSLQRQVIKLTREKDEIMAMKVAQIGLSPSGGGALPSLTGPYSAAEGNAEGAGAADGAEMQTSNDGIIHTNDIRFSKLIEVDNFYKTYQQPEYDNPIDLKGLCEAYRNFACSRMKL